LSQSLAWYTAERLNRHLWLLPVLVLNTGQGFQRMFIGNLLNAEVDDEL